MTELIALVVGVLLGGAFVRWRWPRWAVEYVDKPYPVERIVEKLVEVPLTPVDATMPRVGVRPVAVRPQ